MRTPLTLRFTVARLTFFVLVSVFSCAAVADPAGQLLFRAKCGACHLEGGTGTFMLARRLGPDKALLEKRRDLDAALIALVVRHGIVSMPRFTRAELPDRELQEIAAWLTRAEPRALR